MSAVEPWLLCSCRPELAEAVSKVGMMRYHARITLSDETQRRSPTALAVQLIGRLVEALLKTVPEAACEALDQRVLRAIEGLMPPLLRLVYLHPIYS